MGTRFRIASTIMLTVVALSLATNAGAVIAQTHV